MEQMQSLYSGLVTSDTSADSRQEQKFIGGECFDSRSGVSTNIGIGYLHIVGVFTLFDGVLLKRH